MCNWKKKGGCMMFDNLDDTQFEELCMSLLKLQGLDNVNWRKGTGLSTSPSDNGRDIECEYHRYDNILQRIVLEKWFIECKHYKKGVSPDKLQGALTWAQAENPDRLVIIVSEFLSNPCKEFLKKFKENNKPSFDIEIWERPQLEKMVKKHPSLMKSYNLTTKDDLLNYINDYHLRFIEDAPMTSFEILVNALNKLPIEEKNKIFEQIFLYYVGNDGQLKSINHSKSYEEFVLSKIKEQCDNSNSLAINMFIHTICNVLLGNASPSKIDRCIDFNRHLQAKAKEKFKDDMSEHFENLLDKTNYKLNKDIMLSLYNSFCNVVVKHIMQNPYIPNFKI